MKLRTYAHALIALGIFLVALAAYGVWYARVENESAKAVSLAEEIAAKKESRTRTQEAKDELERALADETAVKDYFVDTADVVPFLESLQDTGSSFGAAVEVESVSAKTKKETKEPHDTLELTLRVTGPFSAVERTLGAIEYQPYDTVVTKLSLDTAADAGSSTPEWVAHLTARVGTRVGGAAAEVGTKTPAVSGTEGGTTSETTATSSASSTPAIAPAASSSENKTAE